MIKCRALFFLVGSLAAAALLPAQGKNVVLWSEANVQAPQTNLDAGFAKSVAGIEKYLKGKLVVVTIPYLDIDAKVNLAVQGKGDVPDVTQIKISKLAFHLDNGTLTDLTKYVESSPWYADMDKAALNAGRGADGKIYAVPFNTRSTLTYYYKDAFPKAPATIADILAAAPALKAKGIFAITGKAAEDQGVQVWWWPLVRSFGGHFADKNGKIAWANDATVKAVQYTRELLSKGYAPDVILSPGFDNEIPFMNGKAGAFVAGSWSYVWLNPLKTPGGKVYDKKSESLAAAVAAGDVGLAPQIAAPGGKPVTPLEGICWAIPVGAKNIEGAKAYIDYMMQTQVHADIAYTWGGIPTLEKSKKDARYSQSVYWSKVMDYMKSYAETMEPIPNFDEATLKFSDVATKLVHDPSLDILSTLKKAQDELNSR